MSSSDAAAVKEPRSAALTENGHADKTVQNKCTFVGSADGTSAAAPFRVFSRSTTQKDSRSAPAFMPPQKLVLDIHFEASPMSIASCSNLPPRREFAVQTAGSAVGSQSPRSTGLIPVAELDGREPERCLRRCRRRTAREPSARGVPADNRSCSHRGKR